MRKQILWFWSAAVYVIALPRVSAAEHFDYCSNSSSILSFCYLNELDRVYPYFKEMEAALVSNNKTLYMMQQVFFPVFHAQPKEIVYLRVCITVGEVLSSNCPLDETQDLSNSSASEDQRMWCWNLQWSRSHLLSLITMDQLLAFECIVVDVLYSRIAGGPEDSYLFIPLQIDSLPGAPLEADLLRSLTMVLSWVRAYARVGGRPSELTPEDKGYISVSYDYWASSDINTVAAFYNYSHTIRVLLIQVFVLLNVCTVLVIVILTTQHTLSQRLAVRLTNVGRNIYWATSIVLAVINTAYIIGMLVQWFIVNRPLVMECLLAVHHCKIPSGSTIYTPELVSVILKAVITLLAFSVEFLAALKLSKSVSQLIPILPAVSKILQSCHCHGRWGVMTIHTFAIWNHMIFVQITVGMAALPLSILGLVAPVETISVVGLVAFFLFVLVIITTYFLHHSSSIAVCHCPLLSTCALLSIKFGAFIVFLLLTITLVALYYVVLNAGVRPTSVGGVFLSLLPSFLLSAIGLFLRSKLIQGESNRTPLLHYNRLEELVRSEEAVDETEFTLLLHPQDES